MEQKKAGIPLVALIIFFALIVGIIITCLIILSTKKTSNDSQKIKLSSENTVENAIVNDIEPDPVVEEPEEGKEMKVNTQEVINPYRLCGNGDTAAKYAIYANGDFTSGDANEELKLKIAFSQFSEEEKNAGKIEKAKVEEKLKNVFGTADGVTMKTIVMFEDNNFRNDYSVISYDYDQGTETFTVKKSSVENQDPSFVTEIVDKAVSYSDRLEIYVTPLYVQVTDYTKDNATSKAYSVYAGYNFSTYSFDNLLIPVRKEDYMNHFKSGDSLDIDGIDYPVLKDQISKNRADKLDISALQQYKYILNKVDDKYVLSSFVKVTPATEAKQKKKTNQNQNQNNGQAGENQVTTDTKQENKTEN